MFALVLFTVANLLYCAGYAVRDIMWLRILTVTAGLCEIPYFIYLSEPLLGPIGWTSLFVAINAVNLVLLVRERRPIALSEDNQRLRLLVFRSFSPRELLKLLDLAEWKTASPGAFLIRDEQVVEDLILIFHGTAEVQQGGTTVATLRDGQFIGEMSYLRKGLAQGDVVVAGEDPLKYLSWSRSELDRFLAKNRELASVMYVILGADLAEKLTVA